MVKISTRCSDMISRFDVLFTKNSICRRYVGDMATEETRERERDRSNNDEGSVRANCKKTAKNMTTGSDNIKNLVYYVCALWMNQQNTMHANQLLIEKFGTVLMILSNALQQSQRVKLSSCLQYSRAHMVVSFSEKRTFHHKIERFHHASKHTRHSLRIYSTF